MTNLIDQPSKLLIDPWLSVLKRVSVGPHERKPV